MAGKNQKREDILASARVLFRENGFHNTKMEDIAQRAGVGKGTLYEYFKNKQDIFDEMCIEYADLIIDRMKQISNMNNNFNGKLLLLFNDKLTMKSEIANMSVNNILFSLDLVSEKTIKIIIGKISEINSIICSMIDQGKDEGLVIKSIPSEIMACMIAGTMSEYLRLKFNNKKYEIKEDDEIFDLLYNGLSVK